MDTIDKELLTRVAAEIMGWKVLGRSTGRAETEGPVFCLDEDTGKPIRGQTYPINAAVLDPGDPPFGIMWKQWRPFEGDWPEIVTALADKGFVVDLRFGADEDTVKVSTQDFYHSVSGDFVKDKTPGRSLCEAALMLMDRTRNLLELL